MERWILYVPSIKSSGSTMGTRSHACDMHIVRQPHSERLSKQTVGVVGCWLACQHMCRLIYWEQSTWQMAAYWANSSAFCSMAAMEGS